MAFATELKFELVYMDSDSQSIDYLSRRHEIELRSTMDSGIFGHIGTRLELPFIAL